MRTAEYNGVIILMPNHALTRASSESRDLLQEIKDNIDKEQRRRLSDMSDKIAVDENDFEGYLTNT